MADVNEDLQHVIMQCNTFEMALSPTVQEIEDLRAEVDQACEFALSGSIVPAALAQDLLAVEKAYCIVSNVLASVDEARVVRKKIADMVRQAAVRASGQSSQDKRGADAEFIVGKFGMQAVRFDGFFRYCEKKLESIHMRYYTVRATLTSIEQDLRIGSAFGMGTGQLVNSAEMPGQSRLGADNKKGGTVGWGNI